MKERLLKMMKSRITASIIYILLGLCLAFMPVTTVYVIYKVIFGVVMIAVGVYQLVIYLRDSGDATLLNMFAGSILVVLGGFLFFNPQIVVKLLPILLGTFVLADSVWSLQAAFRLKKKELSAWVFLLAGSLIFIALGVIAMISPFREVKYTIFFSGCVLLGNGVADVIYLLLIRYWKKTISSAAPDGEEAQESEKEKSPKTDGEETSGSVLQEWNGQGRPGAADGAHSDGADTGEASRQDKDSPEEQGEKKDAGAPAQPDGAETEHGEGPAQPAGEEQGPAEPDLTLDPELLSRDASDESKEEVLEEWKD